MNIKPGKLFLYVGFISLTVSLLLLFVLLTNYQIDEKSEFISVLSMLLFFFLGGTFLLLHYFNYEIVINAKSIIINSEFNRQKEIHLNQIEEVGYNKSFNLFIIKYSGNKVRISNIYPEFLNQINESKYSEKLKSQINTK
jgi:hypothetical protein